MDPFSLQGVSPLGGGAAMPGLSPLGLQGGLAANRCCGAGAAGAMAPTDMGPLTQMVAMQQQITMMLLQILMELLNGRSAGGGASAGGGGTATAEGASGASGGSAASGSGAASGAEAVNLDGIQGGTEWGRSLAKDATSHATGSGGWCYKYVAQALARHGVNVSGASAYMAADQLARSSKFKEVKVAASELPKLPPGAIVVWDKGAGHPHGHISIATGDGREASDVMRKQITNYGTSFRVFLPNQ